MADAGRETVLFRRIRFWTGLFIVGLALSGLTAFPLIWGSGVLLRVVQNFAPGGIVAGWIGQVHQGLVETGRHYPFLAYGTDWLAFAHLVLAAAFIGPWRDPVKNKWVIQFGLIACAGVVPLALIAGAVREIPLWWRLGDCCFGVCGAVPLWIVLRAVEELERQRTADPSAASV